MKKFVSFALAIALVCALAAAMAGAAFAADKADITINGFNCPENEGVTAVLTGETVGAELYWWYVLTFEPDSASGGYKCVDKKTIGEGEETGTISKKDMAIPAGGFAIGSNTGNDYPSLGQTDKPNYVTAANNAAFNAVQATEVGDIVYLVGVDLEKGTIDDNATDEQIAAADAAIRSTPHVVGVTYMSPQDVLATYGDMLADYTNLQQVFENDNPFTPNYRVAVDSPDDIESVSAQLLQIDGVASVNAPLAMADTFTSLQRVINYACYGIVAVLAIVSIVVINNTIKITVFNRRKEIGIMKLVGATNGFIRFPFFVEGVTSGLISAGIASGIVCGAYYALCRWYAENPSNLSQMFGGTLVPLESVWYYIVGGFVLLGFVLCGLGTATSIRKHLNV